MTNKLQELTDKLYNEGLSKGRQEGEQVLAQAKEEADRILKAAKEQAEAIISESQNTAASLKEKAESDIKTASSQSIQATKKDIENLLLNSIVSAKVDYALKDKDFIKEIISSVAKDFGSEAKDLSLILPESMQGELEKWVSSELSKLLGKGVKAEFSKKIQGGFNIGPGDGGWYLSFSDETFKELITEYLRPVTKKLLFGL